jgi:hypothetical protein
MNSVDYSYIAGIMDGEGCIATSNDTRNGCPTVRIAVSMADSYIPQWLHEKFSGSFIYIKRNRKHLNERTQYVWSVSKSIDVINFLEKIIPYLKIKKNRAKLALKLANLIVTRKNNPKSYSRCMDGKYGGQISITDEERKIRQEIRSKIREYNQRIKKDWEDDD